MLIGVAMMLSFDKACKTEDKVEDQEQSWSRISRDLGCG